MDIHELQAEMIRLEELTRKQGIALRALSRASAWLYYSDAELRLRIGEATAQELRTARAVLRAALTEDKQ